MLVKLRQCGLHATFPVIYFTSVRSLPNKMGELLLLIRSNRYIAHSEVLCFTESWLCDAILDSGLHLPGFQLLCADRFTEQSGKSKGSRTCFYVHEG